VEFVEVADLMEFVIFGEEDGRLVGAVARVGGAGLVEEVDVEGHCRGWFLLAPVDFFCSCLTLRKNPTGQSSSLNHRFSFSVSSSL